MTHPLQDLTVLDQYKTGGFPPGYDLSVRRFYSPVDGVHPVAMALIQAAQRELVVAMFGFDDDLLADAIAAKMANPNIVVQLTLDKSQAGGVHERDLLNREKYPANLVAVGSSEHGRIMHMKLMIIDGVFLVTGSTNWSTAAETLQDNELTVRYSPIECAEARIRVNQIHAHMLGGAA